MQFYPVSQLLFQFLQLFTGLGCMEGAYHIDLQTDTKNMPSQHLKELPYL